MTPLLVNILTFTAVFVGVFACNGVLVDLRQNDRKRIKQRMDERWRMRERDRARSAQQQRDFSRIAADAFASGQAEDKRSSIERLKDFIEQSGFSISLTRLVITSVASGGALGIVVFVGLGNPLAGVAVAAIGSGMPLLYVSYKRTQRLNKLREQLPDAFELMGRVMRSGQTITQSMQAVADEFDPPISAEFLCCYEQMNLGLPQEAALRDLGRRTGLLEIKIFVLAVVVHRQTGGNLAELFDKLAYVVRERFRISGMIQSLTAQGRLQAGILMCLPPGMFVVLMVLHREYEMILLGYPLLIAGALSMMGVGWIWIRRIVNFDF